MSERNRKGGSFDAGEWVLVGFLCVGAAFGAWLWLVENWVVVLRGVRVVVVVLLGLFIVVWLLRGWWLRRSGGASGGGAVGGGWGVGDREVVAVVPSVGGGRRGVGLDRRRRVPALEFWPVLLRQAARWSGSCRGVVRALWSSEEGGGLVWGVSVDRQLAGSVRRAVGSVWPTARVVNWPAEADDGGAVVRRYLVPEDLCLRLESPSGLVEHPMGGVVDALADHPDVDVELRVDLVPLSPALLDRVCEERLNELGEYDADRSIWETDDRRRHIAGVRVLLRVSRGGVGHLAECERVADRVCESLDAFWSTGDNWLVARSVSDQLFDRIWTEGVLEKDVPVWHWDCLRVLLEPPPVGIAKVAAARSLSDPPRLETFNPGSPGDLMPVGVVSERGRDRLVSVRWGGPTDALVEWIVGSTGSGKTWNALGRVISLAETGGGFLFLDPHRTAVADIKEFIGARHANRIVEIDLQATDEAGEPVSAGWNLLDLTVVPPRLRKGRIDNLRGILPQTLFPGYAGAGGKAPQTATLIRKSIECLLQLNHQLPADIQASLFCMENLLLDDDFRDLVVARLKPRDQKWWRHTFPLIVGQKGPSSTALKPVLNALEQWKTKERVQALLGASQSTLRWRDIIDQNKILLVVLNNDRTETDNMLARLMVGEMITAFKERSLTPDQKPAGSFHLFLDEFQSYATALEAETGVIIQELRKYHAKAHLINQSPSAVPKNTRDVIIANCTHLVCGRQGNPADAETLARAMGGQQARNPQNPQQGAGGVESRDLMQLPKWQFINRVTQNGELSTPFRTRGINIQKTWAHLRTDQNITQQIAENTGLQPVEQRLDHYDTLPDRITHWLQHQPPARRPTTRSQPRTTGTHQPPAGSNNETISDRYSPPSRPATGTAQSETFDTWAKQCITEDPQAAVPTAALVDSYLRHCQGQNLPPMPQRRFQQHLTHRYGPSEPARINGKVTRVRRGITLRNMSP